jgi:hypothetical protein
MSLTRELGAYIWQRRNWWLIPVLLVVVLFGSLLVFAQSSVLAPFIYTIF